MIVLKLVLFMLLFSVHHCRLPDKVYCVNEQCNEPISKARTILAYNSGDHDLMSFRGNAEALVYMKSAGANRDLWYANIDGKSGFVSSRFLKEMKVYDKEPAHILPVQVKQKPEVQPDKVQQAHEVVDGTTIYPTEPTVNNDTPDSTNAPAATTSNEESTPSMPSQDMPQSAAVGNENIWEQVASNKLMPEASASSATNKDVVTVPPPLTEPQMMQAASSIQETIETSSETSSEQPVTAKNLFESEPTTSTEKNVVTTTESSSGQTSESIPEVVQNVESNQLPPSLPEMVPVAEPLVSGEILNPQVFDVPSQIDITDQTLAQPAQVDSIELNTSNPVSNVETPPQVKTPSNVPDNNIPRQVDHQVPQYDNSLFGSMFNQDSGVVNNFNGEIQQPGIQEAFPQYSKEIPTTENIPLTSEILSTTTETVPIRTESVSSTTEHVPTTETIPASTESVPIRTESVPSTTEHVPTTETIPASTESVPLTTEYAPTTTETIPTSTESLPVITESVPISTDVPVITDTAPLSAESLTSQETADLKSFASESAEYQQNQDNLDNYSQTTASPPTEDIYTTAEPATPSVDENGEGFISSMFSTVSSMFDSTTPAPPAEGNEWEANIAPPPSQETSEEGFSFLSYLFTTYNNIMGTQEQTRALFASTGETCFSDEYCESNGSTQQQNRLLTFLVTSAGTILLFMLGYYYLDNRRQDGKLIGNINSLQRDLLFATKECEILKEELTTTKTKLTGIEDSSFGMDDMVLSLKEEINELKAQNERLRHSLDDNEKLLRVSENTAGELQNTLGEVENTLSELLGERAHSEEQIAELNGKIQAFEEELISISRERDNYQLKYVSAEAAVEESKKQKKLLSELNEKLKEANNTIELQKHEISALKDALKDLKNGLSSNVDVGSLIDHTEIKAKLAKALEEKKSFESKYEVAHKERSRLSEELETAQEALHTTSQQATEASTRLEVLGKYFQERESELIKELSSKESLYLSKQGESASTVEKMELLQQEIQRYKEKCDALTLELAEQESTRRTAISEVEARAHQAWLDARAARRDADAARDDAAALRRKLASLTADGANSPHTLSSPLENMDGPVVPPPLPPLAFLPPPLLPPLPRPPPLGRLPSPHPPRYERRYSPDSRYSPESRYSPGSRYSPETVRYSPDSRYSPRRREPYSPRRRYGSDGRGSRSRNGPPPMDTETEYNSDSPTRDRRPRPRYSRHSGPSSGSGCSSESDK
ncbi:hypothetical protein O0L34_g11420 [Tuta absoluta]|nr:hypothetical protein O0L34_g11420 [Tuta absoluta]